MIHSSSIMPVVQEIDDYDLSEFSSVARRFGTERYGYVVTPNTDHVIRYYDDASFRSAYSDATYVLLDSRFLANLLRVTQGIRARVCTGSDLTEQLFTKIIAPEDVIVLIGASDDQARRLAGMYGLKDLRHFNPPMGFIRDPQAVEACLQFIESQSPFRFCLLAVGAPQQEIIAQRLKMRGRARGLAMCIGASINFLTGAELRAPHWMRWAGLEWAFRLAQDPKRLARRYLIRGPRVFGLLRRIKIVVRRTAHVPAG